MTPEERKKLLDELMQLRQEIDLVYAAGFTRFVEAVHSLSLMLTPLVKQQEAVAYKLVEIEQRLRNEIKD